MAGDNWHFRLTLSVRRRVVGKERAQWTLERRRRVKEGKGSS